VRRDRIRNIFGAIGINIGASVGFLPSGFGALFSQNDGKNRSLLSGLIDSIFSSEEIHLSSSRVVPTGADNAPSNFPILIWRKTSD
jgi:hypothetical protein